MEDRRSEGTVGLVLAAVAFAWALALALLGAHEALLYCAPALLIAAPLTLRRYPGERLLERAARALAPHRPRPKADPQFPDPAPRPVARMLRGGHLMAAFLASRPPPARALS